MSLASKGPAFEGHFKRIYARPMTFCSTLHSGLTKARRDDGDYEAAGGGALRGNRLRGQPLLISRSSSSIALASPVASPPLRLLPPALPGSANDRGRKTTHVAKLPADMREMSLRAIGIARLRPWIYGPYKTSWRRSYAFATRDVSVKTNPRNAIISIVICGPRRLIPRAYRYT
jgi:hypothetical protein